MQIILALIVFSGMTLQVPQVRGEDNGNTDKGQVLLFEKSFPTESSERLKFCGYGGDVKINSWCRNIVKIRIYGRPDALKYLNFKIGSDEMGINIGAIKKYKNVDVKNLNLRYEICIPRDYDVKVKGGKKNGFKKLPISKK